MTGSDRKFLTTIKNIKLQLENLVDDVSPSTHSKTVITLDCGIKVCLTSGYMKPVDTLDPLIPIPDYINNTKIVDLDGNYWYYTILTFNEYLLEPINFVDGNPTAWQISMLTPIDNPLDVADDVETILLDNQWHKVSKAEFSKFVDAFIAFKLLN